MQTVGASILDLNNFFGVVECNDKEVNMMLVFVVVGWFDTARMQVPFNSVVLSFPQNLSAMESAASFSS